MIEFTDVTKSYSVGTKALRGVTMQIEDGEFAFLVGPSGSGKSTIIKLITGELQPTSGTVHVNGYSLERIRKREVPYLRRTVGVVFQDFRLIENKTVYDNVAFAMRVIGAREREIRERVPYVLELVGLDTKSRRHPGELSGGAGEVWQEDGFPWQGGCGQVRPPAEKDAGRRNWFGCGAHLVLCTQTGRGYTLVRLQG